MRYKLLAPTEFRVGRLTLAEHQVASRAYALRANPDGTYEPAAAVQFKQGEVIGYEGPMPRVLQQRLEAVPDEPAPGLAPPASRRGRSRKGP